MERNLKSKEVYEVPRYILFLALTLQFIVGGLRFSDGRLLRTISSGDDIYAPIFQDNPLSQYIWESPLKILILKTLSTNSLLIIGLVFLIISLFPILGIFFNKRTKIYKLTALLILATPAFKISIHNIGLGDGLTLLFSIFLILFDENLIFVFISISTIGIWHPGQAPFIFVSSLFSKFLNNKSNSKDKSFFKSLDNKTTTFIISSILGLFFSRLILIIYNMNLNFEYINRLDYLLNEAPKFVINNIIYSPISLVFPFCFFLIVIYKIKNLNLQIKLGILLWILICSITSILTTDVSRVVNIILFPLYISILDQLNFLKNFSKIKLFAFERKNFLLMSIIFFIALFPSFGWDGINISLWSDFFEDSCKYGFYCINTFIK